MLQIIPARQATSPRRAASSGSAGASRVFVMAALVVACGQPSRAADVEAFEVQNVVNDKPNVLFLVDSTASMGSIVDVPPYKPSETYSTSPADCSGAYAYFRTSTPAIITSCKSTGQNRVGRILLSNLRCDDTGLDSSGVLRPMKYVERIVSTNRKGETTISYVPLQTSVNEGNLVFCESYTGTNPTGPGPAAFTGTPITLFHGNWLNYNANPPPPDPTLTDDRMSYIKEALYTVATNYRDKINIGLMRTSTTGAQETGGAAKGGMVMFPVKEMSADAIYEALHFGPTTLDDFQWTLQKRVACKNDPECKQEPEYPDPNDCRYGSNPTKDCVQVMHPNGSGKPLAELLYEANLYYSGSLVDFGTQSTVDPTIDYDSVDDSLANPGASTGSLRYESPVTKPCANNYIILLTDGLSQQDASRNTAITSLLESLPTTILEDGGYNSKQVRCSANSWSANAKAPSECIDDLAFYLKNADFDGIATNGRQGARTFAVGFNIRGSVDELDATRLLNDVAAAGGTTSAVFAENPNALTVAVDSIVATILSANTSFSAPSVTINAFNRTQNLNDLYMAVFRPEFTRKWEGNVKKYTIRPTDGKIVDANGDVAVDETKGFFTETSQSLWSSQTDGRLAPEGGAASVLPGPASRNIYVNNGANMVSLRTFSATAAPSIFDVGTSAEVDTLVEWLYGNDTYDEYPVGIDAFGQPDDGNGVTDEDRRLIGDPLHSRPAVVVYGRTATVTLPDGTTKTAPDQNDAVVYITTNEGLLHAFDAKTGVEKWSFMPQELLDRLTWLRDFEKETPLADRTDPLFYGLDGTVRVLRIDRNGDGPIDSTKGDRVFLFFGMRRGGSAYFGFDVTNPDTPKFMWRKQLPDGAQSWSNPTVGEAIRVNITTVSPSDPSDPSTAISSYGTFDGFVNSKAENRFVLIIGGGFDPSNDRKAVDGEKPEDVRDLTGNKLYMLDAVSGNILWSAGPSQAGSDRKPDLLLEKMRHSIVGDVRAIDLSGDFYVDRMYAADLGGQVWRFDVNNGKPAASLVVGGVMASVGIEAGDDDRRFYYAPDVSEVRCGGKAFYNVAIGSGDRENPVKDKEIDNTFFSFRDTLMRNVVDSANYRDDCSSTTTSTCMETIYDDSSLVDVTATVTPSIGPDARGWKLNLVEADPTGGEKALAESRTFANNVYFTTYAPELVERETCGDQVGVNRLYVVNACNATPLFNNDGEINSVTVDDRSQVLAQGSIAPEVVFVFPSPPPGCTSQSCMPPPQCLVGLMSCGRGMANRPVRVFWRERGAE